MARAPSLQNVVGDVDPSGAAIPYVNPRATEDAFGASVGRAMERSGAQTQQRADESFRVALAMQDLQNETLAKEADIAFSNTLNDTLSNPKNGFLTKMGKDAAFGYQDVDARMQQAYRDHRATLGSPRAQQMFDAVAVRRLNYSQGQASNHAATENRRWMVNTGQARINQFKNEAYLDWRDDRKFNERLGSIASEASDLADLQGLSGEAKDELIKSHQSEAWMERIRGTSNHDLPYARRMLDQAMTPDDNGNTQMRAKDAAAASASLDAKEDREEAKADAKEMRGMRREDYYRNKASSEALGKYSREVILKPVEELDMDKMYADPTLMPHDLENLRNLHHSKVQEGRQDETYEQRQILRDRTAASATAWGNYFEAIHSPNNTITEEQIANDPSLSKSDRRSLVADLRGETRRDLSGLKAEQATKAIQEQVKTTQRIYANDPSVTEASIWENPDMTPAQKTKVSGALKAWKTANRPETLRKISERSTTEFTRRMNLKPGDPDRLNSLQDVYDAEGDGRLTATDGGRLEKRFNDARQPGGETLSATRGKFIKSVAPQLDQTLVGKNLDPYVSANVYAFDKYVDQRVEQWRKEGKDPMILFQPTIGNKPNPDFLGSPGVISGFLGTMVDQIRSTMPPEMTGLSAPYRQGQPEPRAPVTLQNGAPPASGETTGTLTLPAKPSTPSEAAKAIQASKQYLEDRYREHPELRPAPGDE